MPQLRIDVQHAQTGMQHTRPHVHITQHDAVMNIDQELAGTLEISQTASRLFIDQTEAFADANLKAPLRAASEWATSGKEQALSYVAKKTREGEQLKQIEKGGNALSQVAKNHSHPPTKEVTLGYMPKTMSRVQFDYQPSQVSVHSEWPDPQIEFHMRKPEISAPLWEVDMYMKKKASVTFSVDKGNVNRQI
ncbi:DUF6470 family protein [Alteribacter aurantiacus]|uniref:DUF6470 family protein n=1 Tax=Alteribacter aurantiacus TaxID=254410 RepID=UPI001FDEA6A2|nr:DUF6470 family protein [Alteribacter aurantiacus]